MPWCGPPAPLPPNGLFPPDPRICGVHILAPGQQRMHWDCRVFVWRDGPGDPDPHSPGELRHRGMTYIGPAGPRSSPE